MAKEVIWSKGAIESFDKIIAYLKDNCSEREISRFIARTNSILSIIKSGKVRFRISEGRKNIHEVLITKQNLLVYCLPRKKEQDRIDTIL